MVQPDEFLPSYLGRLLRFWSKTQVFAKVEEVELDNTKYKKDECVFKTQIVLRVELGKMVNGNCNT